ncbi:hypothetical protein [Dysosmobacter sp. Phy]
MEGIIWHCPALWRPLLPPRALAAESARDLTLRRWSVLALTERGCGDLERADCGVLLVPGDRAEAVLARVRAETVVTCGLSQRDSLTLSSLSEPVVCLQRALLRPDGGTVEPQEFPLPPDLPAPAEALLPLFGLRLLQMSLTEPPFSW